MNKKIDKEKILEELMKVVDPGTTNSSEIDELFSELIGNLYQKLVDAEFEEYQKTASKEKGNRKNGISSDKKVKTKNGEIKIKTPRDRTGNFEPQIVQKRQRTITSNLHETMIFLYSKGNSLEDIKSIIKTLYKVDVSNGYISNAISKVSEDIDNWNKRQLKNAYAVTYVDCLYYDVKKDFKSTKLAVYVIIGIDMKGMKEVVGIWVGDGSESGHFWKEIFEELKLRGVERIFHMCMDGLCGLTEGLSEVFPKTKTQRCIVHLDRNLYNSVSKKETKEVMQDFKKIYKQETEEEATNEYKKFIKKYEKDEKLTKRVTGYMEHIYTLYALPQSLRKLTYTTNAIESVNSSLRRVTNGKGMFNNKDSLMKILFLRIEHIESKWLKGTSNWKQILVDLIMVHGNEIFDYIEK